MEKENVKDLTERPYESIQRKLVVVITLVFLGIIIFAVSFFAVHISGGKDADQITYRCEEITDFIRVGSDSPLSFPGSYEMAPGEELACETSLPDAISDDTWVCYLSDADTSVYVDGELRKSYDRNKDTIIGGSLKRIHIFVELYPQDAGKTIRIVYYANRNNTINLRPVYIGTSLGIIEHIISLDIVNFILTFALMSISVIAIVIGLLLRFSRKMPSPITAMGVGVLFMSLWLVFDSALFQLAFRHYYIDGTMSYLMVLLIPYPFAYYLDILQERRYRFIYIFCLFYLEMVTVCACLLHFSGTLDFLTQLPFLAITEGVILICIVITLILDFVRGYYKSYLISFAGVIGLLLSCVFEIIRVVTVDEQHAGTFVILGLFWTITLAIIHQLYAVREAQREAAIAVRASETKTNFLANMSHEIRTPMNAILGMDEMILREAKDNAKITKYASDIKSAGNMLLSIINDILDLSKIESGKAELVPSEYEICSVINDIINIAGRRAADKEIEFRFDAAGDIPVRFYGDEIRTRQIMLNIINNAVKYTAEGSVRVNLEVEKDEAASFAPKAGDMVTLVVTVADTGIGIREEDKAKLFQPFDRLEETKNRNIEGTGLGLSIAGNYVELMGGHIDVDSVYGEGSTFTAYLPMQVVDATPIGDFTDRIRQIKSYEGEERPLLVAPNASVLVVDDNEMNLEVISGLMERTKMKVDVALSGPEGIEKMEHRRYDVVFLDQMMPGMDGVTTLKNMRMKYDMRGVSVIALTADAVAGAREYYLEKGFDDYLSKPVRADDLENILIKHLPKALQITEEDVARISAADAKRKSAAEVSKGEAPAEQLSHIVVIDSDSESLRLVKEKTEGIFKGTYVTDTQKAGKYLEKHDAQYVMLTKDIYDQLTNHSDGGEE